MNIAPRVVYGTSGNPQSRNKAAQLRRRLRHRLAPVTRRSANNARALAPVPLDLQHMRLRTFALLLGVPLLLMGALIVGLQIGQDELKQSVRSDPQTSSTTTGGNDGAGAAQRGVSLKRIGTFSSPILVTAPPGDTRRVFVVEQGRHDPPAARRQARAAAVPRHQQRRDGGRRAGAAGAGVRARLRPQRALLRVLHRPQREREGAGVPPLQPQREPREQGLAAAGDVDGRPVPQPQRREPRVRARRLPLHRHGRRRLRRRPGEPRPEPRLAAGQDAAHQPAQARVEQLPLAEVEPVRGPCRTQRDLRVRPAQPMALLLRPPHR